MINNNNEIALTGKLEEFRTTLIHEINAATNTAVDGALKRIGELIDNEQLYEDKVIRAGAPKDLTSDRQLLFTTHVERRSAEFAARKQKFEADLIELVTKAKEVSKTLDICEWVIEAQEDFSSMEKELNILGTINKN
jgi:hypothetical protein